MVWISNVLLTYILNKCSKLMHHSGWMGAQSMAYNVTKVMDQKHGIEKMMCACWPQSPTPFTTHQVKKWPSSSIQSKYREMKQWCWTAIVGHDHIVKYLMHAFQGCIGLFFLLLKLTLAWCKNLWVMVQSLFLKLSCVAKCSLSCSNCTKKALREIYTSR